jgi:thiamine biosynthesis lipoprotein
MAVDAPSRPVAPETRDPVPALTHATHAARAMGGRLGIHVATRADDAEAAVRDAGLVAGRVVAWSRLLTRHDPGSPLMRLNADPRATVPLGPTLAAALVWADDAGRMTGGLVDVTHLAERLAAESAAGAIGPAAAVASRTSGWHLDTAGPRRTTVTRTAGTGIDLDGVGKGWIADRALGLLGRHPGAVVDADGDVAVRVAPGDRWEIGVDDPRGAGDLLAVIVLADEPGAPGRGRRTWGVATSGTSVHRFGPDAHHLIDPRTGRPAATDVVQATVLASGAAVAEAFAKSAVILGSAAGLDFLDRAGVAGAIVLLEDGRVLALPRTSAFLA